MGKGPVERVSQSVPMTVGKVEAHTCKRPPPHSKNPILPLLLIQKLKEKNKCNRQNVHAGFRISLVSKTQGSMQKCGLHNSLQALLKYQHPQLRHCKTQRHKTPLRPNLM